MVDIGENVHASFERAETVIYIDKRFHKERMAIDVFFDNGFKWRIFDFYSKPQRYNYWKPLLLFSRLIGCIPEEMDNCPSWEAFCRAYVYLINKNQHRSLFLKLVHNRDGFPEVGEYPAFSDQPDMEYTDDDLLYTEPISGDDIIDLNDVPE